MDEPKNRNEDKPWSETDISDLRSSLKYGSPVGEIAEFLPRREDEIRAKMAELRLEERH